MLQDGVPNAAPRKLGRSFQNSQYVRVPAWPAWGRGEGPVAGTIRSRAWCDNTDKRLRGCYALSVAGAKPSAGDAGNNVGRRGRGRRRATPSADRTMGYADDNEYDMNDGFLAPSDEED